MLTVFRWCSCNALEWDHKRRFHGCIKISKQIVTSFLQFCKHPGNNTTWIGFSDKGSTKTTVKRRQAACINCKATDRRCEDDSRSNLSTSNQGSDAKNNITSYGSAPVILPTLQRYKMDRILRQRKHNALEPLRKTCKRMEHDTTTEEVDSLSLYNVYARNYTSHRQSKLITTQLQDPNTTLKNEIQTNNLLPFEGGKDVEAIGAGSFLTTLLKSCRTKVARDSVEMKKLQNKV